MQRHSGQLPARRYGPRRQQAHNRHGHTSAAFPSAIDSRPNRSHLKSDDESASPIEHSMASSAHHSQQQSSHQLTGSAATLASDDTLSPSHVALKLAHASSSREQSAMDSIISPTIGQHQIHVHRSQASSPPTPVQFGPSRFYSTAAPTMAPLAHSASWLAAAGVATVGLGGKGRPSSSPYEQFGLGSYASFAQHPGSHLGRLSLLNSPQATHSSSATNSEQEKQPQATETAASSSQPGNQSSQHQNQYAQPTANPDFSQLLEN